MATKSLATKFLPDRAVQRSHVQLNSMRMTRPGNDPVEDLNAAFASLCAKLDGLNTADPSVFEDYDDII